MTTRAVSRTVPNLDFRKGVVSATAVFVVISVAITGLAMDISVNTLVDSFQSSNEQSSINWFGDTISAQALELCKSSDGGRATPISSNYTQHIAGMQNIDVETDSYYVGRNTQMYEKFFSLGFGDGSEKVMIETRSNYGSYNCDDVSFNGTGTGSSISGLDGSAPYNYRLFSSSEGEVTIQVMESEGT